MNKKYIYNNGTVTIIDEKENARPIEYSDNLEEILIQENLIEDMEKRIKKFENTKINNNRYFPNFIPALILAIIVMKTIIIPSLDIDTTINTIFGTMNLSTIAVYGVGIISLPLVTLMDLMMYRKEKEKRKNNQAKIAEYEYLKKDIINQKEKLKELQQKKTKTNENTDFKVETVNDLEALNMLKKRLILYKNLGYNIKKYYKLYEKGKLEQHLIKEGYDDFACKYAKEYIEEKGPTLVKKSRK